MRVDLCSQKSQEDPVEKKGGFELKGGVAVGDGGSDKSVTDYIKGRYNLAPSDGKKFLNKVLEVHDPMRNAPYFWAQVADAKLSDSSDDGLIAL